VKIIHVTFSLPNAGKENMLVDIANEQLKIGNETGIIIINDDVAVSVKNRILVEVKRFELNRKRSSKSILPIIKLISILNFDFKADVLHVHDPALGNLIRYISRIPMVLTVHNTNMDLRSMRNFNKIFAISDSVKKDIESRSDLHCKVIYNGIRVEEIRKKDQSTIPEIFKIILVKRLDHLNKGQDLLVNAMNLLINKKGIKKIKLYLIGDGPSRD